jgi:GT2 family glycosyltransferase
MIAGTLRRISQLTHASFEVIVVDQSDHPLDRQHWDYHPRVRYFHTEIRGLPRARNFGLALARGDIALFCDDDIIPGQQWLDAHEKNYSDPAVGAVAGRVIENSGEVHCVKVGAMNQITGRQVDNFNSDMPAEIDHGMGCNLSFRAETLRTLNGFDTRFGGTAFLEETDTCLRLKSLGYTIRFEPAANVIHLKADNGGCRPRSRRHWYYWYGHNYSLLFFKNFKRIALPLFMAFRIGNMVRGGLRHRQVSVLLFGLKGLFDGMRSYYFRDSHSPFLTVPTRAAGIQKQLD